MKYKLKFWWWFLKNIAKHPPEMIFPNWIRCIQFLLFPIKTLVYMQSKGDGYQWESNTWKIHGVEFSDDFFIHFAISENEMFKYIRRENGCITIETIHNRSDHELV